MSSFPELVKDTVVLLEKLSDVNIGKITDKKDFYDYKETRLLYLKQKLEQNLASLVPSWKTYKHIIAPTVQNIIESNLEKCNLTDVHSCKTSLIAIHGFLPKKEKPPARKVSTLKLPPEIADEINADLHEIEKCSAAGCYRSVTILCGRILETALHRKYYEVTANDLLEKAPGIGLGKIIAKLEEKGIKLGPGLTQQVHLVNQVRIYSVHTKAEPFYPSKGQAEAIFLFTQDILEKIFK